MTTLRRSHTHTHMRTCCLWAGADHAATILQAQDMQRATQGPHLRQAISGHHRNANASPCEHLPPFVGSGVCHTTPVWRPADINVYSPWRVPERGKQQRELATSVKDDTLYGTVQSQSGRKHLNGQ